jgi:hypothetical protein
VGRTFVSPSLLLYRSLPRSCGWPRFHAEVRPHEVRQEEVRPAEVRPGRGLLLPLSPPIIPGIRPLL